MQKQSNPPSQNLNATQSLNSAQTPPFKFYLKHPSLILDGEGFNKHLLTHPTSSKSAVYTASYNEDDRHAIKECQRVLLTSRKRITKLQSEFNYLRHFGNKHVLFTIRHLSSLSSLQIELPRAIEHGIFPQETEALFKTLTSLKNLKSIDIILSYFSFHDLTELMKAIRKAIKVSSLSVRFIDFHDLHYQTLFSGLAKLNRLLTLKLILENNSSLSDSDINTLASSLPKLASLTKLNLTFNGEWKIYEKTLVKLFKAFQSMINLTDLVLDLRGCQLKFLSSNRSICESFKCLTGMSSLKKFRLGLFRNFCNRNLSELSEAVKEWTFLSSLCLNFHWQFDFAEESLDELGLALTNLTSLTSFEYTFTGALRTKNLFLTIGWALTSLQNLTSLKLEFECYKKIQDKLLKKLFRSLRALKCLENLEIKMPLQELITDASIELFGESLKELKFLKSLSLDLCWSQLLTNKSIEAICSAIQGCLGMSRLSLQFKGNKKFDEKAVQKVSETLKSLNSLHSVELSFIDCVKIQDLGEELFDVLTGMNNIQRISLGCSDTEKNNKNIAALKRIKDVTVPTY